MERGSKDNLGVGTGGRDGRLGQGSRDGRTEVEVRR